MVGRRFGNFTVLEFVRKDKKSHKIYKVKCDCGFITVVRLDSLESGRSTSCGCSRKLRQEVRLVHRVLVNYRKSAKKRNIFFDLDKQDIENLIFDDCIYCKSSPENEMSDYPGKYQGIDRVNSNIGYVWENVVPCCGKCNAQKNNNDSTFLNKIK